MGSSLSLVEVHDPDQDVGLIMHVDIKENTHNDADFGEDFVKHHALSDEIESLAVDGVYYRHETVEEIDDKELEINFSQGTNTFKNLVFTSIIIQNFKRGTKHFQNRVPDTT